MGLKSIVSDETGDCFFEGTINEGRFLSDTEEPFAFADFVEAAPFFVDTEPLPDAPCFFVFWVPLLEPEFPLVLFLLGMSTSTDALWHLLYEAKHIIPG